MGAFHNPYLSLSGVAQRAESMHASWMRSRPTLHATGSPFAQPMPQTGHVGRLCGISPSEPLRPRGALATTSDRVQSHCARGRARPRNGALLRAADDIDRVASEMTEPL